MTTMQRVMAKSVGRSHAGVTHRLVSIPARNDKLIRLAGPNGHPSAIPSDYFAADRELKVAMAYAVANFVFDSL